MNRAALLAALASAPPRSGGKHAGGHKPYSKRIGRPHRRQYYTRTISDVEVKRGRHEDDYTCFFCATSFNGDEVNCANKHPRCPGCGARFYVQSNGVFRTGRYVGELPEVQA